MTTKNIRIMFYDEAQQEWVVDTMEVVEQASSEEDSDESQQESSPAYGQTMAYY
jgi:hypothetical protein